MRKKLELAILFLIVAVPASAQRGPQLEVSVLAANSPPAGASVRSSRLLNDRQMRELLVNGFPAALRFRLELWRAGGLFDDLESSTQWEVLVRYDPYMKQYSVVRLQGIKESTNRKETESFGGLPTLEAAESVLDEPFPVALKPRRASARYYYQWRVSAGGAGETSAALGAAARIRHSALARTRRRETPLRGEIGSVQDLAPQQTADRGFTQIYADKRGYGNCICWLLGAKRLPPASQKKRS